MIRTGSSTRRGWTVAAAALTLALLAPTTAAAAKKYSALRVLVQDEEGQPLDRASVVLTRLGGKNDKPKGRALQIKTSMQGVAPLPPLEQGVYMLQVILSGYRTSGERIELAETEQDHTVIMKPPSDQFSVHEPKARK
jgi:hypothetical protein